MSVMENQSKIIDNSYLYYNVVFTLSGNDFEYKTPFVEGNPYIKNKDHSDNLCESFYTETAIRCIEQLMHNLECNKDVKSIVKRINWLKLYVSNNKELNNPIEVREMTKTDLVAIYEA